MKSITGTVFLLITLFFSAQAYSRTENNILFSLKRHTYVEGDKSISIGLRNAENEPYLVQAGMAELDIGSGVNQLTTNSKTIPFMVVPPLYKIKPGSYYDWRIMFSAESNTLPKDRESVYLAQFLFIPSSQKSNENKTEMAVMRSFVFKIYYRPKSLEAIKISDVQDKISFHRRGNTLLVKNNSPVFITFNTLRINSEDIDTQELFKPLPPLSEQTFNVPQGIAENSRIEWSLLDENVFPLDKRISKITP